MRSCLMAQLINATSGVHPWAERFEGTLRELDLSPKIPPKRRRVRHREETDDEGKPVQRGADYRDPARAGGRGHDSGRVPRARDFGSNVLHLWTAPPWQEGLIWI